MKKNEMYFDVHNAKIYKDLYRPSTNISRFFKTLWGIMVVGDSPISSQKYYSNKKTR